MVVFGVLSFICLVFFVFLFIGEGFFGGLLFFFFHYLCFVKGKKPVVL